MQIVTRAFRSEDLIAGHPAVDLVNTVTARNTPDPRDWIDGYDRLLEWAELAAVLEAENAGRLRSLAAQAPLAASRALGRAKLFREAFYVVCLALIAGQAPSASALEVVEGCWRESLRRARLVQAGGRVEPRLDIAHSGLDLVVDALALGAIDLLRSFPQGRARLCQGSSCGWLFIDTSKGGRRIWCDMATCGNTAKSRRHQARLRGG